MFAVVKTGGKQYKVSPNDIIEVEKLEGAAEGSTILLSEVIAFNDGSKDHIDAKSVAEISVAAEVVAQKKSDKIIVFKKNRRHNYRRLKGHRQPVSVLKIAEIGKGLTAKDAAKESPAKKEAKPEAKKETATAKTAAKKPAAKKAEAKKEDK